MIACTSSSDLPSISRSSASTPFPASPLTVSVISAASWKTAWNWSRTIFRKKKSRPWIAVVPSYRVSILASRMYCSIG